VRRFRFYSALVLIFLIIVMLTVGCSEKEAEEGDLPADSEVVQTGTLIFTANGEEFIREGFVCKDGWELSFDHAYVTLASISAFQTEPPYDTSQGWGIDEMAVKRVDLGGAYTLDLAASDADPVVVGEVDAVTAGRYNALYWELVRAHTGPSEGYVVLLIGKAEKDGVAIDFSLGLDKEVAYLGGEYVGDERKGILQAGGIADVEMTFHFDHLFGDFGEDQDNDINVEALGFGPLAALASDGKFEVSLSELQTLLSSEDYQLLEAVMTHLAHVGEGHCLASFLQ
jgi:hypothetical protein